MTSSAACRLPSTCLRNTSSFGPSVRYKRANAVVSPRQIRSHSSRSSAKIDLHTVIRTWRLKSSFSQANALGHVTGVYAWAPGGRENFTSFSPAEASAGLRLGVGSLMILKGADFEFGRFEQKKAQKILPPTPKPSFSPVVLACPLAYRSPSSLGATVSKRFARDRSTTDAAERKARLRREQERILRDSSPTIPWTRQAIVRGYAHP